MEWYEQKWAVSWYDVSIQLTYVSLSRLLGFWNRAGRSLKKYGRLFSMTYLVVGETLHIMLKIPMPMVNS